MLEGTLRCRTLQPGPVQQAVGIEGVVDPAAFADAELETHTGAALAYRLAVGGDLRRVDAVFLAQVFDDVLAFGLHPRVQFEGLEVQRGLDLRADAGQGLLQRVQADCAPGAGDI